MSEQVNKLLRKQQMPPMMMYVPPAERLQLRPEKHHIIERKWHKIWKPFLAGCKVWHAPFQSGRIIPERDSDTRVVLTVHDLNALHEGKPRDEQLRSLAHTQNLIDRSDAIVCISEFTRNDVLNNCDVNGKPIHVIHNGLNKLSAPQLESTSYRPRRPFLFGLGYVNTKKNYHVLLPLLLANPDLELVVAGHHDEPEYASRMRTMAEDMGVSDRLFLAGPVSESEKAWYLNHCMAFLHPSLAEGFGFTVVEAMSFGKPVFISNLTSLPEIGGDAAFYFSDFEAEHMQRVFREGMHTYNTTPLAEQLKKRAENFSMERSASQYLDVYQSLL